MVKVWCTGGFIVNIKKRLHYNQSGQGACVFGLASAIKGINFSEKLWLQDTVYARPDDVCVLLQTLPCPETELK